MGDGGVILQIRDATGGTVVVSDDSWQCRVIHTAPFDKSCESERHPVAGQAPCGFDISEEPGGWDRPMFEASGWAQARVYTAAAVGPKFRYNDITWGDTARLIWGPDLEQSNTVLCRFTVG
ncbi:hypothetical protein DI396_09700 [Litorivita pollutaquae]|uniref:Uncharacterized protein n=1 Tax=Litorivita pollutaquae TaxID=2200892 RepID=A0A2V4NBZ6_9RHOB|nr:hypothetical protein DI396_09700 [Litorivita pollutaquae]